MTKKTPAKKKTYPCDKCKRPCSEDDYCYGCRTASCPTCTINPDVTGFDHAPDAHWSND